MPSAKRVALYDGHCRLCTHAAERLRALAGDELELVSFHEPGVLDRFPGLTFEQCMQALQLVEPDGRLHSGAAAVVEALADRWYGPLLRAYYLPGARQLADAGYAAVARLRYRFGRVDCASDACALHAKRR